MITINETIIGQIPALEFVQADKAQDALPLCIFYHGWESCKERAMVHAYEIAKGGCRVVVPDSIYHGQRQTGDKREPLHFLETLVENVREFPDFTDYYTSMNLFDGRVFVGGYSMGGMTAGMLLATYPEITGGVIFMGALDMVAYHRWLIEYVYPDYDIRFTNFEKERERALMASIRECNLASVPERLNHRPVYVWHGGEDVVVPMGFSQDLLEKVKDASYADYVHSVVTLKAGHQVPYSESVRAGAFIKACIETPDDIWGQTQHLFKQRFGYSEPNN